MFTQKQSNMCAEKSAELTPSETRTELCPEPERCPLVAPLDREAGTGGRNLGPEAKWREA